MSRIHRSAHRPTHAEPANRTRAENRPGSKREAAFQAMRNVDAFEQPRRAHHKNPGHAHRPHHKPAHKPPEPHHKYAAGVAGEPTTPSGLDPSTELQAFSVTTSRTTIIP